MTSQLIILANQIIGDWQELAKDVESGLYQENKEGLIKEMKRINEKLKEWAAEANAIIEANEKLNK